MKRQMMRILILSILMLSMLSLPSLAADVVIVNGTILPDGVITEGSYTEGYVGTIGGSTSTPAVSVATALEYLNGTIATVSEMRAEGSLNSYMMKGMLADLERLERALVASGEPATPQVAAVVANAEKSVKGLSIAEAVLQKISDIKSQYNLESIKVEENKGIAPCEPFTYGAAVNPNLKSFSDVPPGRWSHIPVMNMVKAGLFNGVSEPDSQGVAQFSPDKEMKRSEFLTVVIRFLYSKSLAAMPAGETWYANAYELARQNGILKANEFAYENLDRKITREEMTMILIRAVEAMGETIPDPVPLSAIADYTNIDPYYLTYVRQAFAMGLLTGYDEKGTFKPNNALTREQAPAVINRLLDPSTRANAVGGDNDKVETYEDAITIYEGETRSNRPAREGDIFVKKDGTQIVLKKGEYGVLGAGQGVAPDLGLMNGNSTVAKNKKFAYDNEHYSFKDSLGNDIYNQLYQVNQITGEGHWEYEWDAIFYNYQYPEEDGTYEKQPSPDPYKLWYWRSNGYRWVVSY